MKINEQKQYTSIPNNILEAMPKFNLTATDHSILEVIARKTFGWHKATDIISASQFVDAGCGHRVHILRRLKILVACKLLVAQKLPYKPSSYGINLNTNEWTRLTSSVGVTSNIQVRKLITSKLPTKETTKENTRKQNKYSKVSDISVAEFQQVADHYGLSIKDVEDKWTDLLLWLEQEGKTKKNYKSFLMNCINRDIKLGKLVVAGKLERELEKLYESS